jgi:hypothetical protein
MENVSFYSSVHFTFVLLVSFMMLMNFTCLFIWDRWNDFRVHCNSHSNLFPVIEVPVELPDQRILDRWYGESIKAIVMSRSK